MAHVARVQKALSDAGLSAVLLSAPSSVQWISDFTGSFGCALVTPSNAVFVTDSRYALQANQQVKDLEVKWFGSPNNIYETLSEQFVALGVKELGFEPSISYSNWETWKTKFEGIDLVSMGELVTELMKIKTPAEVAKITEACKLGDACMQRALSMVQVGVSEYDIGLDIEFFFRKNGAQIGFDPIVASGPNSAKPHARPTERKIEKGDFVTIDLGCTLDGYSSDLTRTVVVGEATERHREIYEQVLRAEVECCQLLVAGSNGKDVDQHARNVLDEKDLGQYFGHSLGHGLGRAVHDPGRLYFTADEPLAVGQVWTVEPGVYIEGFGGVRVEDDVVITENGPEILTKTPKAFTIV
ncbi:MAG: aminopeptidase P family protein [Chthonomonas sp.]|nr:aminopeptidase P family protein [Chthonomonas sp.]